MTGRHKLPRSDTHDSGSPAGFPRPARPPHFAPSPDQGVVALARPRTRAYRAPTSRDQTPTRGFPAHVRGGSGRSRALSEDPNGTAAPRDPQSHRLVARPGPFNPWGGSVGRRQPTDGGLVAAPVRGGRMRRLDERSAGERPEEDRGHGFAKGLTFVDAGTDKQGPSMRFDALDCRNCVVQPSGIRGGTPSAMNLLKLIDMVAKTIPELSDRRARTVAGYAACFSPANRAQLPN